MSQLRKLLLKATNKIILGRAELVDVMIEAGNISPFYFEKLYKENKEHFTDDVKYSIFIRLDKNFTEVYDLLYKIE